MRQREETEVSMVIASMFTGGLLGLLIGVALPHANTSYKDGFRDGKEFICSQPQVPFKRVDLPACAEKSGE